MRDELSTKLHTVYLHIRIFLHKAPRHPGRVEEPLPVSLVVNIVDVLPLPGEDISEELLGHLSSEVILESVAVDQGGTELLGGNDLQQIQS